VNDDQVRSLVPVGMRGTVEDIAAAVCFLASPEASISTATAWWWTAAGERSEPNKLAFTCHQTKHPGTLSSPEWSVEDGVAVT
jgi:hypothetical protein